MKKILSYTLLSAALSIAMNAQAQADRKGWPKSFTVGTASQGGTYYVYGSGWANLIATELGGMTGAAEVTGGPTQNLALVQGGDLILGLTTLGPAADAIAGKSPLAPGFMMDNVCALFPMYETPFSLVTLKSKGINQIAEIPNGAKIGFGPAGATADIYFPQMLEKLGAKFERRNGGWSDLSGQLQDGLIDAIGFGAGIPIPAISQLEVQTDISIISLNDEEREKILASLPVSSFDIPQSTYKSLDADLKTVSMWNFAFGACDLPENFAYEITRITMENNDKMQTIHKSAKTSLPENTKHNQVMPFHKGAAKWFNENGYPIPAHLIHQ